MALKLGEDGIQMEALQGGVFLHMYVSQIYHKTGQKISHRALAGKDHLGVLLPMTMSGKANIMHLNVYRKLCFTL